MKKTVRILSGLLGAVLLSAAGLTLSPTAGAPDTGSDYVEPAFAVDFSTDDGCAGCTGLYHVTARRDDDGMTVLFENDTGRGVCFDPYLSLTLPRGIDIAKTPYLALLVRTDKWDARGEIRFRTDRTGNDYPCLFFDYEKTDGFQLIVLNLTDRSAIHYASGSVPLSGTLSNLRLDMFENECDVGTGYTVKAYGFYATRKDADTFASFVCEGEAEAQVPDFSDFWRGDAYAVPDARYRMRWVAYGFSDTAEVDAIGSRGYGGIVSNVPFDRNYLKNDAAFASLARIYDYAVRQGMSVWIYDEYQWPSGKAFGQVLDAVPEGEATGVSHLTKTGSGRASYTCSGREISILWATLTDSDGERTVRYPGREVGFDANGAYKMDLYVLRYTGDGVENRDDFTTLRSVDLLRRDTTGAFISLTHERYRDLMGDTFENVGAFFTDEPQLGNRGILSYCVWTEGLDGLFRERYGYELHIPSIFSGDTASDRRCRLDYYRLVSSLFRENYFEQIKSWCGQSGTLSSGHCLFEENMCDQVETYGGDFLQILGGMSMPGVDLLWVDTAHLMSSNYVGSYMGIRYAVSAAKNAGAPGVMVEFNPDAMGTLSDADPLGECLAGAALTRLLGTTVYNVINPQNCLTVSQSRALNDALARMNALLDGTRECGEVAVFYPIATVQAYHDADRGHGSETLTRATDASRVDARYQSLCKTLLTSQVLYTVLDDESIRGATVTGDGRLAVGDYAYRAVVIPYTKYISQAAMEKLTQLVGAGGYVAFVSDLPDCGMTDAEDAEVARLSQNLSGGNVLGSGSDLVAWLSGTAGISPRYAIDGSRSAGAFVYGDFEARDRDLSMLVNVTPGSKTVRLISDTPGQTQLDVYRPLTPSAERVTTDADGSFTLTVGAGEAVIIGRAGQGHAFDPVTPYVPREPDTGSETATDENPADDTGTEPPTGPETGAPSKTVTEPRTDTADTGDDTGTDASRDTGCRSFAALPSLTVLAVASGALAVTVSRVGRRKRSGR